MSTRTKRTIQVMKTLALHQHSPLPFQSAEGTFPIVVALPSDYVSDVVARIRRVGGSANLAVASANAFELYGFSSTGQPSAIKPIVINQDLSMGMLAIRIKKNPGRSVRLVFRDTDTNIPEPDNKMQFSYAL